MWRGTYIAWIPMAERGRIHNVITERDCKRQLLIRMFSRIHLNLPIESANKNTQNSEMNSACFCLHFFVLEKQPKKWYN